MSTLRRSTLLLASLVVLTAATLNLLIAWTCALWSERPGFAPSTVPDLPVSQRPRALANYPVYVEMDSAGIGVDVHVQMGMTSGEPDVRTITRLVCGWPCRALAASIDAHVEGSPPLARDSTTHDAIDLGDRLRWTQRDSFTHSRYLPIRPRPVGFVLNTLAYALLLVTLGGTVKRARSLMRRRAGRCTSCGYQLAGLSRCPECGNLTASSP